MPSNPKPRSFPACLGQKLRSPHPQTHQVSLGPPSSPLPECLLPIILKSPSHAPSSDQKNSK